MNNWWMDEWIDRWIDGKFINCNVGKYLHDTLL